MRLIVGLALGALVGSVPGSAKAEFISGNELLEKCSATPSDGSIYYMKDASCRNYVLGAADFIEVWMAVNKKPQCISERVTAGQITDVVKKYLIDHPEERQHNASVLVYNALKGAFGCSV